MSRIKVILARGAGNPMGRSFVWDVARQLDPKVFYIKEIPYYAEIAPIGTHTMAQSMAQFKELTDRELADREFWMGIGYSLGAAALNAFVGTHALSKCKGIGMLSDPRRHSSQYMGPTPEGYGVAGGFFIGRRDYPVWSYAAPRDPITAARANAGIRVIAGTIGAPGVPPARPDQAAKAFADPQLWTDLWNYGPGGRHTCYGTERMAGTNRTYVQHLADQMNAEGKRLVAAGVV